MSRIIEIKNLASPPIREKLCDPCAEDNEDLADKYPVPFAQSFCLDCHQNLCQDWCSHHQENQVSKLHKVVSFGTKIDADALAASSLCAQHPAKPLEMLCMECQAMICVMCFAESHHLHKCADVNSLVPEFKNTMKANVKTISALRVDTAKEMEIIETANIHLLADVSNAESAIVKRGEQLRQLVDRHTEQLLNELAYLMAMKAKEIEIAKGDVGRHIALLDSYKAYCLSVAEKGSAADICQASNLLHDKAAALEAAHRSRTIKGINSKRRMFSMFELYDWLGGNCNLVGKIHGKLI